MADGDSLDRFRKALEDKGHPVTQRGEQYDARCPAHDDKRASFGFRWDNGKIMLNCLAGCSPQAIVDALGLKMSDLFDEDDRPNNRKEVVAEYDYKDANGALVYQVVRYTGKQFVQRHPGPTGEWVYNLRGVSRVPYRYPELRDALAKYRFIFIPEGEQDVETLRNLGMAATTNAGGAKWTWPKEWFEIFRGAKVVLLPDNDDVGKARVEALAPELVKVGAEVRIIELPVGERGDVTDWVAAGGTAEQLKDLVRSTPEWTPGGAKPDKPKQKLPVDAEAERLIIGSTMVYPNQTADVCEELTSDDFSIGRYGAVWYAFEDLYYVRGVDPDAVLLATEAKKYGGNISVDELEQLRDAIRGPVGPMHPQIVRDRKKARDILRRSQESISTLTEGGDPSAEADSWTAFLTKLDGRREQVKALTISDVRGRQGPEPPVLIPGCFDRTQRVIFVAGGGTGKSTTLKAIAFMSSQGVHPFNHSRMRPFPTMLVDCENSDPTFLENLDTLEGTLRTRVGQDYDERRFRWYQRPDGIDLRRRADRSDLQREITLHRPELVIMGPLYKMMRRKNGESYEEAADSLLEILDDMRTRYGFGLMIETHAPNAQGGEKRMLRPYGSMYLEAWPDYGFGLRPDEDQPGTLHLERFRGDRRKANWPSKIQRDPQFLVVGYWENGNANANA